MGGNNYYNKHILRSISWHKDHFQEHFQPCN